MGEQIRHKKRALRRHFIETVKEPTRTAPPGSREEEDSCSLGCDAKGKDGGWRQQCVLYLME